MVPELDNILAAFEDALVLERELGTRVLDFDRAVLRPPAPETVQVAPPLEEAAPEPAKPQQERVSGEVDIPAPSVAETPPPPLPPVADVKAEEITGSGNSFSPDFMFVVETGINGEAESLFGKMVSAMGYPDLGKVSVLRLAPVARNVSVPEAALARISETVAEVKPKAIVLFGSTVVPYFFPGKMPGRGLKEFAGVPAMVTFSPSFILRSTTPNNAVKKETWESLKLILAKIGKTPPGGR